MTQQFTASEVREAAEDYRAGGAYERAADMLTAFADLLEAREKAVPVAWWNPENAVAITPGLKEVWTATGGGFADDAARYTIPLHTHPPSDAERLAEPYYIGWCRYKTHDGRATTLHLCDSDDEGAFRIYRHAHSAHSAQARPPAASVVDIDTMVNRFLGWKLPQDFAPDAGISFKPMPEIYMPHCWPTGTNLFHAGQAKEMILHMLAAQENPNG